MRTENETDDWEEDSAAKSEADDYQLLTEQEEKDREYGDSLYESYDSLGE